MARTSRVVWSQGTFLQPHHFQQLERSIRADLASDVDGICSRAWGFTKVEVDRKLLRQGQFGLVEAAGRFPDGTFFVAPGEDHLPAPVSIGGIHAGKPVFLGIAQTIPGQAEFGPEGVGARYEVVRETAVDATDSEADPVEIEVGRLRLVLLIGDAAAQGHSCIPIAVIQSIDNDGAVALSDTFIPTVLQAEALAFFRDMLRDVYSRLLVRARNMAGRSVASGRLASTEHFLEASTLMSMNRYLPVFGEYSKLAEVHPFQLYLLCAQAACELSTFSSMTTAAPVFDGYRHHDLHATFSPVLRVLFEALGQVIAQSATQIPLEYVNFGIFLGRISDARLVARGNQFVLCVNSDLHPDDLRERFPAVAKVAPPGRIKELVKNLVPGVPMRILSSPPPEIRFPSSRSIYFELDSSSTYWTDMRSGFAIHIADEFPSLKMELWVISAEAAAR